MKLLTITVPAYNAEKYLEKCLQSMIVNGKMDKLEVIIVNDGSNDRTSTIAKKYIDKYPMTFRLIEKENGGHGSGINKGIELAQGKYFKVIDADDWVITESCSQILDILDSIESEIIITSYHTVDMATGKRKEFSCNCKYVNKEIGIIKLLEVYKEISSCCSFHGIMYKTNAYRTTGIHLSEKIFYEDQEYATLPFAKLDKITILPIFFYQYLIGNSEQSVDYRNQVKRITHIEQVIKNILSYRKNNQSSLNQWADEYIMQKLSVVVVSYFAVALVKNPDKKKGKNDAEEMYQFLNKHEPDLLSRTVKKYKTLRFFWGIRLSANVYEGLLNTKLYKKVRAMWQ